MTVKMSFLYRSSLCKKLYNRLKNLDFLFFFISHTKLYVPSLYLLLLSQISFAEDDYLSLRVKREFMYASGQNSTDPECFQVRKGFKNFIKYILNQKFFSHAIMNGARSSSRHSN